MADWLADGSGLEMVVMMAAVLAMKMVDCLDCLKVVQLVKETVGSLAEMLEQNLEKPRVGNLGL
jgi:hypothetical protein